MSKPINTDTREGAAIAELYTAIVQNVLHDEPGPDADWNGGDVVDLLTQWFDGLGFDLNKRWEEH